MWLKRSESSIKLIDELEKQNTALHKLARKLSAKNRSVLNQTRTSSLEENSKKNCATSPLIRQNSHALRDGNEVD